MILFPFMIPYVIALLVCGSFDYHYRGRPAVIKNETHEPEETEDDGAK